MTRKIAYYVIIGTLIWGAATEDGEKIREIFKSNMTRGDFSNLLKSLIRLNEQRVNVLQKLYRLEDYSVLSEVLRSGDKKKGRTGNLSNLFLVVLSKNQSDPLRRKMRFQVLDSVPSLDTGNFYVGGLSANLSKTTETKPVLKLHSKYLMTKDKAELNLRDNSERLSTKYDIGDGRYNPSTTKQVPSHFENKEQESVITMDIFDKPQGRFEIVGSEGINNVNKESPNGGDIKPLSDSQKPEHTLHISLEKDAMSKLLDFASDPTKPEAQNSKSNENEVKQIRLTIERPYEISNSKLQKSGRNVFKEVHPDKPNTNTDNPREDSSGNKGMLNKYFSILTDQGKRRLKQNIEKSAKNNPNTKRPTIISKKNNSNLHLKKQAASINRDKSQSEQQQDSKHNEQLSDTSNENAYYMSKENKNGNDRGNENSKTKKYESNEYTQSNKFTKSGVNTLKSKDNLKSKRFSIINTKRSAENGMLTLDFYEPLSPKTVTNDDDDDDRRIKYPTMSMDIPDESAHDFKLLKIPMDRSNENYNSQPKDSIGYQQDKPILNKDVFGRGNQQPKMDKDSESIGELTIRDSGGPDEGSRDKTNIAVRESPLTPFDDDENYEPEAGRESRKTFQKCLNKKANKMCSKSCISAYKNVCRKLKCTSRSKKALKKECKRSCKKTFASKSSKYSEESDYDSSSR